MYDPSEFHQTAGLAQLAEVKRTARAVPPVATTGTEENVAFPAEAAAGRLPWQFRLRTMLALVAGLSGLFAVMHVIGAVWSAMLVWFLILALAHVTANFWGTRIAPCESRSPVSDLPPDSAGPANQTVTATGAVRLSESRRPGWPMLIITAVGALAGGTLGCTALVLICLDRAGYAGVILGTASAAVVGGFLGYLTSSFAVIALRAWKEALSGSSG